MALAGGGHVAADMLLALLTAPELVHSPPLPGGDMGARRRDMAKVTLPAGGWRNTRPDICSLCHLLWLLVVLPWSCPGPALALPWPLFLLR